MYNIEFSHQLPPDTEEKVRAIAVCLMQPNAQVKVKVSSIQTATQEIKNYTNVIEWLLIIREVYGGLEKTYSIIGNAIKFYNSSEIIFADNDTTNQTN